MRRPQDEQQVPPGAEAESARSTFLIFVPLKARKEGG